MNSTDNRITREVVLDLLPAVRAGTASADSRALVERFLAQDPELAARAALMPFPSVELELQALNRTRSRLNRGKWMMGLAIFFTLLPLSGAVTSSGIDFVLMRDAPLVAAASLVVAVGMWLAFVRHRGGV
jgi:hypothetical protein